MQDQLPVSQYNPDSLATAVADMWSRWDAAKKDWKKEKEETRNYLFATSTRDTENKKLPWKNSTVTPKLTQIRDNLHANYMAALFPSDTWFSWEASDAPSASAKKRNAIQAYMREKLKASNFQLVVSQLVYDYIDYGNVFVGYQFVSEQVAETSSRTVSVGYVGPKAFRVSPLDIVMNPMSSDFNNTPIIRRVLKSMGDIEKELAMPGSAASKYSVDVLAKCKALRKSWKDSPDIQKAVGLRVDGFGSADEYIKSGLVELLEFWGDIYDEETGTLHQNQVITVVDRRWVIRQEQNTSPTMQKPFFHCGWRLRPDNLWAAGPLDQLVGMQYRIDHLENLKADVFDQIAHPVIKVKGNTVEDFNWGPGEQVFCGDEGDVDVLRPDATALNADIQIQELMARMEELAGAPKQAMGIRTPGEKTKYEVQVLENGAGRIFQSKVSWFEKNILEPLLNAFLAQAVENVSTDKVRTVDDSTGAELFIEISKEDLAGSGKLYPVGARHFAEKAKFVQEATQIMMTVTQDQRLQRHTSYIALAKALEDAFGWGQYGVFKENVGIEEEFAAERVVNQMREDLAAEASVPSPLGEVGIDGPQQPAEVVNAQE